MKRCIFFLLTLFFGGLSFSAQAVPYTSCDNVYGFRSLRHVYIWSPTLPGRINIQRVDESATLVLHRGETYYMTHVFDVQGFSDEGNRDPGQVWVGYKNATFTLHVCEDYIGAGHPYRITQVLEEDGGVAPGSAYLDGLETRDFDSLVRIRWVD